MEPQEKKSRRAGMITSLCVHSLLLVIFFFASGYRAPYPPAPEYGVIVNVGFDDQGTGEIQTDQPVSTPDVEEQKPEEQPQPVEPDPAEQKPEQKEDDQVLASNEESPVTVKKEEEKPKEKPKEEVVKPKETPKEETKPKETEKLKTEYKPDATTASNNSKGTSTTSEGDDANKTGNKGQPNGTLDPNGQYTGTPGGGGGGNGFGLAMGGWGWDEQPKLPQLPDNEDGRIEFEIECDADGQIIGIKTLQRGLSPKAEQLLKDEILRHSLVKNSPGAAPEKSKGKVVFILKTR